MNDLCKKAKQRLNAIEEADMERKRGEYAYKKALGDFDNCISAGICPRCGEALKRVKLFLGFLRNTRMACSACQKTWVHNGEIMPAFYSGKCNWAPLDD
jgi:hypothetical protein